MRKMRQKRSLPSSLHLLIAPKRRFRRALLCKHFTCLLWRSETIHLLLRRQSRDFFITAVVYHQRRRIQEQYNKKGSQVNSLKNTTLYNCSCKLHPCYHSLILAELANDLTIIIVTVDVQKQRPFKELSLTLIHAILDPCCSRSHPRILTVAWCADLMLVNVLRLFCPFIKMLTFYAFICSCHIWLLGNIRNCVTEIE